MSDLCGPLVGFWKDSEYITAFLKMNGTLLCSTTVYSDTAHLVMVKRRHFHGLLMPKWSYCLVTITLAISNSWHFSLELHLCSQTIAWQGRTLQSLCFILSCWRQKVLEMLKYCLPSSTYESTYQTRQIALAMTAVTPSIKTLLFFSPKWKHPGWKQLWFDGQGLCVYITYTSAYIRKL